MGKSGVKPSVSPKSYSNLPRVSFGHDAGSAAIKRVCFPPTKLSRKNGNEIPQKFDPPPKQPITTSG